MDLDSCGNDDNFIYDEIASFMPQSGDYSLDDIDEILRSTALQLDSSIDLSSYVPHNVHDFEMPMHDDAQSQQHRQLAPPGLLAPSSLMSADDEFNFSMPAYLSPSTTTNQSFSSQRTSSTSSMDDDHFNPDEFMSFLNDDHIKIEDFTRDTIMQNMPQRNTPSPTGSCTSSSGSSTSGVQSDASSVASMSQTYSETQTACVVKQEIKNEVENTNTVTMVSPLQQQPALIQTTAAGAITTLPVSMPAMSATAPPAILQPVQPLNVIQGSIIPIKTMPLTTTSLTTVGGSGDIKMPTPIKIEPKLAPKSILQPTVKVVTPPSTTTGNAAKITPPPNAKPKTIFLSSNDFKALMQKMNTNGKGAKITGGINGQVPKIIMKTSNGKVITTTTATNPSSVNKVVTSSSSHNAAAQNFVPKILKATGPLVIKQHPTKLQTTTPANAAAICASRGSSISPNAAAAVATSNLSIYRGMIDEKIYKKQQRMIKNRESASLSRKKKKEYVVSLESRINDLEKENYKLKGENTSLRSQLVALAQTCQCKNSNISEFVLNSLNIPTKTGGGGSSGEHHHHHHHPVKIAPKPSPKSMKQRMLAANVKKNVAVLFAMAFMVTLNVGNFQTYLNKNSIENSIEAAEEPVSAAAASGRRLLWVETETEFNEKLNRSKRETELEVPPLHFIHPVNSSRTASRGGNATAAAQHLQREGTNTNEPPLLASNCSGGGGHASSNQTENLRLLSNLHKWIDGNDYLNLSLHDKYDSELEKPPVHFKLTPDYFELKSIDLPLQGSVPRGKRKIYIEQPHYEGKQAKLEAAATKDNDNGNGNGKNSLDLFKPKISDEYLRLFKGIKRQDDTFYVLSFNMDHILLPASAYNKSARPKMSLMLPAGDPSLNGDIVLMQIDCEVMNTTELQLKSYMIPEKLRPIKYSATPNPNDVSNNETGSRENPHENMPEKSDDELKVKSVPRTYFMMGPKTQAAAALKRKATIVKFNSNESVVDNDGAATNSSSSTINTINVKNSTLFTKMRATVGVNFKNN